MLDGTNPQASVDCQLIADGFIHRLNQLNHRIHVGFVLYLLYQGHHIPIQADHDIALLPGEQLHHAIIDAGSVAVKGLYNNDAAIHVGIDFVIPDRLLQFQRIDTL